MARKNAIRAIGVFTNMHHRQLKYCVRMPPAMRPMAAPTPERAPYTPKALARSLESVKVTEIKDWRQREIEDWRGLR